MLLKILWLTGVLAIISEAVGWALSATVFFLVSFGLASSGVTFLGGRQGAKKSVTFIASFFVEFLPFVNLVPMLTIWTWLTIRQSRKEDREQAERDATMAREREERIRRSFAQTQGRARDPRVSRSPRMRNRLKSFPHPVAKGVVLVSTGLSHAKARLSPNDRPAMRTPRPANDNRPLKQGKVKDAA